MKRTRPVHALLLCAAFALCLAPTAATGPAAPGPEQPAAGPELLSPPAWQPAAGGSFCEGACGGAEIHYGCNTTSAQQCCRALRASGQCTSFSGICEGDAEIVCQF